MPLIDSTFAQEKMLAVTVSIPFLKVRVFVLMFTFLPQTVPPAVSSAMGVCVASELQSLIW